MPLPRLRPEVRLTRHCGPKGDLFVLVDPVVRQQLALDADGARLAALLQSGAEREAEEEFDAESIHAFVQRLSALDLLERADEPDQLRSRARRRLQERQLCDLRDLVGYAMQKLPFYRSKYEGLRIDPKTMTLADFARLPVVTREEIRRHFPEGFVPEGMDLDAAEREGRIRFTQSSGTSDVRLQFATSERRRSAQEICGQLINWRLFDAGSAYRAAVYTTPRCSGLVCVRDLPQMAARVNGPHLMLLAAEDPAAPTLAEVKKALREIEAHGAQWLVVDPAYLALLTYVALDHGLKLPRIRGILAGYELLSDLYKNTIERAWDCPIYEQYTSTEVGKVLMLECEHRGLHVNDAYLYTELWHDGRAAAPGEVGVVLQTTLRETIPLIRYDTQDLAIAAETAVGCACGGVNTVLRAFAGRNRDCFANTSGEVLTVRHLDGVIAGIEGVRLYQLVQTGPAEYELALMLAPTAPEESTRSMASDAVRRLVGEDASVHVEVRRHIYPETSGKFRLAWSELPEPPRIKASAPVTP